MPERWLSAPLVRATRTYARRELQTVVRNRFLHVFSLIMAGAGTLLVTLSGSDGSVPVALLQLVLYVVPLFALLMGVSAAHEELDERAFLFSQPVPRVAAVFGQWLALWLVLGLAQGLAVLPGLLTGRSVGALLQLWLYGVLLGGIFTAWGVALGYRTSDRARGVISGLLVWFGALVLYDLAALMLSHVGFIQRVPELWVALLMVNPLDAVRLSALTSMQDVPFTTPEGSRLVEVWLSVLPLWLIALTGFWTALPLWLTSRRLDHIEV